MTEKNKRFCDEYLIDLNATQAAIRAGYSKQTAKNASRWLDPESTKKYNPEMDEYIKKHLEEMQNEKTAEAREVLEYLTSVMRGEHTEQVLKLSEEGGQVITDINVSEKDRLKAAELIGKRYGLFKENVDVSGSLPVVICDDVKE